MTPEDAPKISDAIMSALLQMFSSSSCKSGGVQEDALMAVSMLVEVLGEQFLKYMDAFMPYLALGLKNHAEYQVCSAAVGLTGDICRALSIKVLPYCDDIMTLLMENLSNAAVHRSVKPQILSAEKNDYDMIDYVNELREGCLEAYTGIIQGLKGDQNTPSSEVNVVQPHVPYIIQFITHIAQDPDHSDGCLAASAGVIGDLCSAFGHSMISLVDNDIINELLTKGRRSKTLHDFVHGWQCMCLFWLCSVPCKFSVCRRALTKEAKRIIVFDRERERVKVCMCAPSFTPIRRGKITDALLESHLFIHKPMPAHE
ncbi:Importin subunit beta-1 like protein [Argiope bruennichi]|uniref:Importin subunit beta-1 like protein n=1 Tax=Argiope bruennichi TaxID=94029 RepID=A0A8T0FS52_ARGBR|nr:Importin subunit beta-1 like protein [Argiope bruennichi]